jgi:protein archease
MEHLFRVLEHTADVGFEAFGRTLEEVFANAACALVDLTVDLDSIRPSQTVRIRVQGNGRKELLVNWLSEILYLEDAEMMFFRDFEITELSESALAAEARGEKLSRARHSLKLLVKAVTYHQLALERIPQGWRAQVYVDI